MSIYGVVRDAAGGHVVTTILIAMVAMLFTAVSYGRMARVYPSAGSAYTYVGKEIHPLAGYVVGWSILMDYILNPLHCAIWARCSGTKHFAADSLCGIGFDGSSTMSEEVENPRRNILLATALTCFAIGVLSAVEVYLAQLAWPARAPFPASMVDTTAFVQVALRVGGNFLFQLLNATLLIANMGSGIAAQFGAALLLYGMGRGGALPRRFFGVVSPRRESRAIACLCSGLLRCLAPFC